MPRIAADLQALANRLADCLTDAQALDLAYASADCPDPFESYCNAAGIDVDADAARQFIRHDFAERFEAASEEGPALYRAELLAAGA